MNFIEAAALAAVVGVVAGLLTSALFSWRTWRDVAVELRYHGLDNHFCQREGCCQ